MCNKNKYTLKEAKSVLNECKRNRAKKYRNEVRYYECSECKSFHLTSEEEYNEREYIPLEELKYKNIWQSLMK